MKKFNYIKEFKKRDKEYFNSPAIPPILASILKRGMKGKIDDVVPYKK